MKLKITDHALAADAIKRFMELIDKLGDAETQELIDWLGEQELDADFTAEQMFFNAAATYIASYVAELEEKVPSNEPITVTEL